MEVVHRFCERLERGGSFDFQRQVKRGSSYFKTGIGTYLLKSTVFKNGNLYSAAKYCSVADI